MEVTLSITLNQATGAINVEGPVIENKVIAYGLLEMAHEAIHDYHAQKAAGTRLVPVNGHLAPPNGVN